MDNIKSTSSSFTPNLFPLNVVDNKPIDKAVSAQQSPEKTRTLNQIHNEASLQSYQDSVFGKITQLNAMLQLRSSTIDLIKKDIEEAINISLYSAGSLPDSVRRESMEIFLGFVEVIKDHFQTSFIYKKLDVLDGQNYSQFVIKADGGQEFKVSLNDVSWKAFSNVWTEDLILEVDTQEHAGNVTRFLSDILSKLKEESRLTSCYVKAGTFLQSKISALPDISEYLTLREDIIKANEMFLSSISSLH